MLFILIFVFVFNELGKYSRIMKQIVLCFPILIVLDNAIEPKEIMRYDKASSQKEIKIVKDDIEAQYNNKYKAIAYMPKKVDNTMELHINVMLASQELYIPCVNAYTGHTPGEYNDFNSRMDEESLIKWCNFNRLNPELIQQIRVQTKLSQ